MKQKTAARQIFKTELRGAGRPSRRTFLAVFLFLADVQKRKKRTE